MKNTVRVALVEPNTNEVKDIRMDNTVEGIQSVIGGYFQMVTHRELGEIVIICDEDGRSKDLKENIWYDSYYIVGNVVFSRSDELGELIDLTDEDFQTIKNFLWG